MTQPTYRLQVLTGTRAGETIALDAPALTIGRYPLADIVLDDPGVAYRHAVLVRGGAEWQIADQGSETGTFVNGQRLATEPAAVGPGDTIDIGGAVLLALVVAVEEEVSAVDEQDAVAPEPPVGQPEAAAPEILPVDPEAAEAPVALVEPVEAESPVEPKAAASPKPVTAAVEPAAPPVERRAEPTYQMPSAQRAVDMAGPPAPPQRSNRRVALYTVGCLLLLLLACCGFTLFMYYIGGDWLLRQLGLLP